jgi:hypothetical protein
MKVAIIGSRMYENARKIKNIPNGENSNGSMSAIKNAKKYKKPVTIIS